MSRIFFLIRPYYSAENVKRNCRRKTRFHIPSSLSSSSAVEKLGTNNLHISGGTKFQPDSHAIIAHCANLLKLNTALILNAARNFFLKSLNNLRSSIVKFMIFKNFSFKLNLEQQQCAFELSRRVYIQMKQLIFFLCANYIQNRHRNDYFLLFEYNDGVPIYEY